MAPPCLCIEVKLFRAPLDIQLSDEMVHGESGPPASDVDPDCACDDTPDVLASIPTIEPVVASNA